MFQGDACTTSCLVPAQTTRWPIQWCRPTPRPPHHAPNAALVGRSPLRTGASAGPRLAVIRPSSEALRLIVKLALMESCLPCHFSLCSSSPAPGIHQTSHIPGRAVKGSHACDLLFRPLFPFHKTCALVTTCTTQTACSRSHTILCANPCVRASAGRTFDQRHFVFSFPSSCDMLQGSHLKRQHPCS